ncbi:MAG: ParA family protein [Anaerolineales bacterium]
MPYSRNHSGGIPQAAIHEVDAISVWEWAGSVMLVAIASMKGGVGKSTLAAMLAKHVAGSMGVSVTVVDMDPQRGATILLLGPRKAASHTGPTMYDVLQSELDNIPSHEILARAIVPSAYHEGVRLVPACTALANIAGPETPRDLLRLALCGSINTLDPLVIIDTGPDITLCEMSIIAADLIFIPVTLSHQSGVPTLNTLQTAFRVGCPIGGLIPTMVGTSQWSEKRVAQWRESLRNTQLVKNRKIQLLTSMPYSQSAIRGTWRWGKLPHLFIPALKGIEAQIYSNRDSRQGENANGIDLSARTMEGIVNHG